MKVASINVLGLILQAKRQILVNWVEQQKIDVLCLQKTFCMENRIK